MMTGSIGAEAAAGRDALAASAEHRSGAGRGTGEAAVHVEKARRFRVASDAARVGGALDLPNIAGVSDARAFIRRIDELDEGPRTSIGHRAISSAYAQALADNGRRTYVLTGGYEASKSGIAAALIPTDRIPLEEATVAAGVRLLFAPTGSTRRPQNGFGHLVPMKTYPDGRVAVVKIGDGEPAQSARVTFAPTKWKLPCNAFVSDETECRVPATFEETAGLIGTPFRTTPEGHSYVRMRALSDAIEKPGPSLEITLGRDAGDAHLRTVAAAILDAAVTARRDPEHYAVAVMHKDDPSFDFHAEPRIDLRRSVLSRKHRLPDDPKGEFTETMRAYGATANEIPLTNDEDLCTTIDTDKRRRTHMILTKPREIVGP